MEFLNKKFEQLTNLELYEIYKNRQEVFISEQNCAYNDIDAIDLRANHLFFKENNELIAYLRIFENEDRVQIGRVLVKKEYRGLKIATILMKKALDFIQDNTVLNKKQIYLSAQTYAINLYKSVGFEISGNPYLEDDIEHIDMFWKGN
ncbi:GNAT family N-acetyltransferase [[Mycoplasma] gypis]|uniref:GNAT family N-acetyltransferase n=1 Tax=[Mycoplasma] gypis TaxID=92404 RepID=A0ABZ2RU43_9BACT|nr:GNAT family N-acetyltransferase [[Mycoplasma] gypis]MBN0919060.1 GNAT family N-acetyltransferase [[Mycoplasma] gypis]